MIVSQEMQNVMRGFYENGATVKDVAQEFGMSVGKAFYLLRDAGCVFRKRRFPCHTEATRMKISAANKGKRMSDSAKAKLSEAKRSRFNGLNGYGHTKRHNRGYELVYAPCHPHAHKDGYVLKHTVIMERQIGRYLHDDEVVHHINHIRDDNRIENLALMNKHEHRTMHMRERHEARRNDLSTQ